MTQIQAQINTNSIERPERSIISFFILKSLLLQQQQYHAD